MRRKTFKTPKYEGKRLKLLNEGKRLEQLNMGENAKTAKYEGRFQKNKCSSSLSQI